MKPHDAQDEAVAEKFLRAAVLAGPVKALLPSRHSLEGEKRTEIDARMVSEREQVGAKTEMNNEIGQRRKGLKEDQKA